MYLVYIYLVGVVLTTLISGAQKIDRFDAGMRAVFWPLYLVELAFGWIYDTGYRLKNG